MVESQSLTFAESLRLQSVPSEPDTFTNVHEPWTWPSSPIIPGGLLMSQCALAAMHTTSKDFTISSLHAHFLAAPSAKKPLRYHVTRLSDGGRFATRTITLDQDGRKMLHVTVSFVHDSKWTAPAMTHAVTRKTNHVVDAITMDDLERGRGPLGSFMRFQRLPLAFPTSPTKSFGAAGVVTDGLASCVAQITPPITDVLDDTPQTHVLGVINLSDYHVMDAPLQLSGITFGLPRINDRDGPATEQQTKISTSLNHSVHFHGVKGWRADELTYIEVGTSWARDGRAMVRSEIFGKNGELIATCVQESFYVFKKGVKL